MGEGLASVEAFGLVDEPWESLAGEARRLRELGHGRLVTYSPKVFIPLTKLCRDVCGYCTFARAPRRGERAYMTIDEVLEVALLEPRVSRPVEVRSKAPPAEREARP